MTDYLFITGMSGAGLSTVAAALEDLGWFVIDNMPVSLVPKVAELADTNRDADRVAFVIGRFHTETPEEVASQIADLRSTWPNTRVLYLEATDESIINRFESTRRRHPLDDGTVAEAIARERRMLEAVREVADIVVDTSAYNIHELRRRVSELFATAGEKGRMVISVVSFGFSFGTPRDVDMVLDCRFLPNPHWVPELRAHTGLEKPVRDYVLAQETTKIFIDKLHDLFDFLVPAYESEGKTYLTLAIGCTGGRHRSVVLAEEIASFLASKGLEPRTLHRDIDR